MTVNVGVVGCGRVSRTAHYDAINRHADLALRAVCDIDRSRADEWALKNNTRAFYALEDMLAEEPIDVVSICVPNRLHPRIGIAAANAGKHVLCEKPLGLRLDEVDALIEACDRNNVKLFNILQNRYNRTNQLLKQAIAQGRFGQIFQIIITLRWRRDIGYYLEDDRWRSRRDLSGGVFTNQAVHYVDMMQWLAGAPAETAYAKMATCVHPVDVETHGAAVLRFRNGIIGSFNLTNLNYPEDREGSVMVLGSHGTVRIGGKSMNVVEEWSFADSRPEDAEIAQANTAPPTVYGFGHVEVYDQIARALVHGDRTVDLPDGREGRKSVELLQALYESDRLGREMRLPLD